MNTLCKSNRCARVVVNVCLTSVVLAIGGAVFDRHVRDGGSDATRCLRVRHDRPRLWPCGWCVDESGKEEEEEGKEKTADEVGMDHEKSIAVVKPVVLVLFILGVLVFVSLVLVL